MRVAVGECSLDGNHCHFTNDGVDEIKLLDGGDGGNDDYGSCGGGSDGNDGEHVHEHAWA